MRKICSMDSSIVPENHTQYQYIVVEDDTAVIENSAWAMGGVA